MRKGELLEELDTWKALLIKEWTEQDEQAFKEIETLIKKEVTEEFVKKWADVICQADTGLFGIKGELKLVRQMLKEAGISVG